MRIAACVLVLATATPAIAAVPVDGGGRFDQEGDETSLVVVTTVNGESSEAAPADSSSLPSPIRYVLTPAPFVAQQPEASTCRTDANELGWIYLLTTYNTTTGEVLGDEAICVPLEDPDNPSIPDPPEIPQPPTIGEIWNAAAIPQPTVAVSPTTDGVTGLETWMWASGPDAVTVSTPPLRGYVVTGTATRVGYTFDFGDGAPTTTDTGGSEAEPAARHTYETKGTYTLRVSSVWEATFTMTGPGITGSIPIDAATAHIRATRDYRVVEIRSVLVG